MKYLKIALIVLIFVLALGARLYHFSSSITDWHSWRQVDTSAVSRNFVEHGFDILHPMFEDISNVPSGLDNPKGYRFVEFPIYNILQAGGAKYVGHFTLEEWGRIVSIIASLFSILFIFLLMKKYSSFLAAAFAAGFFALDPFNIYYSRTVLPDPSMVSATLATIYFFDKMADAKNKKWILYFVLTVFFGAVALLLKPYAAFFFLPIVYIAWQRWGWKLILQPVCWLFVIIAGAPLLWWRWWMLQYPAGIPANAWLFNGGNIRFTGAYFYWLYANRFSQLILGFWGLPLFIFGLLSRRKSLLFFLTFVLSSLVYITVIARGNVQHDYYQILIIPSIAMMFGLGVDYLLNLPKEYHARITSLVIIVICSLGMLAFGWYYIRGYYDTNQTLVDAGNAVNTLTPKNAKILTFMDGDTTFLYYTQRQGWSSLEESLPQMIKMGADYIAIPNPTANDLSGWAKEYKVVAETNEYLIINLHQPTVSSALTK